MACSLTLEATLQACAAFLQQHGSEFLLLRIKDEERSSSSGQKIHNLVKKCAKHLPLYMCTELPLVGDVRGRLVVLQDWDGPSVAMRWAGPSMRVQDNWRQDSPKDKWLAVRRHLRITAREVGQSLCVNFISAQFLPRLTARFFAGLLNPKLTAYLSRESNSTPLGIIAMDFPTLELCAQIVRINFLQTQVPTPGPATQIEVLVVCFIRSRNGSRIAGREIAGQESALGQH